MLDTIRMLIADALEISTGEVNKIRNELLEEQTSADARYAATSALIHPEGSTTPINDAYSRAQGRVADLREKARKELPKALAAMIALEVAVQRREEAKRHRDMKWDQTIATDTLGVREEVRDWWARLVKHGVHPHYLKQHRAETIAIIADLVTWKAKGATNKDPDNPWRAILAIYAGRVIQKPGRTGKAKRSVPGTPTRARHRGGVEDYMFNEMVEPSWESGPVIASAAAAQRNPPPAPASPMFDCSIYPEPEDDALASPSTALLEAAELDEASRSPVAASIDEEGSASRDEPVSASPSAYALPPGIPAAVEQMLRAKAEELASREYDDWNLSLDGAIGYGRDLSEAEVIGKVERADSPSWTTPFSYFLEAARIGGVAAGRQAYREVTVQRFMLELATSARWRDYQAELGLAT